VQEGKGPKEMTGNNREFRPLILAGRLYKEFKKEGGKRNGIVTQTARGIGGIGVEGKTEATDSSQRAQKKIRNKPVDWSKLIMRGLVRAPGEGGKKSKKMLGPSCTVAVTRRQERNACWTRAVGNLQRGKFKRERSPEGNGRAFS